MILFLAGTPGIGKTTVAHAIVEFLPDTLVLSGDDLRVEIGAQTTFNPVVEDALNWRLYTRSVTALRHDPTKLVIIDTNGISRRLPFLRYALGEYSQKFVRLIAGFPFALCTRKWGQAYSQEKFNHLQGKVMAIDVDFEVQVDGKNPQALAQEILASL